MPLKTFRGKLAMGTQIRLRLSTNDGMVGYTISKFQIISAAPGTANSEFVAKVHTTDQTGSIAASIDFNDPTLLACVYDSDSNGWGGNLPDSAIIADGEVFNQDVYVNITDASGSTVECNFYLELEQVKLNVNESTFATLKNIRDKQS